MRERGLTIPEIILLGGTRVALGAGIGAAFAVALGTGGFWLAVGIAAGVAIGVSMSRKKSEKRILSTND